ncbi:hypothetical protein L204_103429 [Cryptococcus depauperatus]
MVATVISSFDLQPTILTTPANALEPTTPSEKSNNLRQSKFSLEPSANLASPTLSVSPPPVDRNVPVSYHHGENNDAGPSHSTPRTIPPPPNPRRHRSGVHVSRVRVASGSIRFKSQGDLASIGHVERDGRLGEEQGEMEELKEERLEEEDVYGRRRGRLEGRGGWKRVVSEGSVQGSVDESEDTFWDNSARYYHHLHSRPSSRSGSLATSPEQSPIASASPSPIFVRRNLSLPQNGFGLPAYISQSLSPNQHFLHTHLPPTFPHGNGANPVALASDHHAPATMVFTPTTQEWKDIQSMPEWRTLHGVSAGLGSNGSSDDDESNQELKDQLQTEQHHDKTEKRDKRPALCSTVSAEYLGPEKQHTLDPGSPSSIARPLELQRAITQPEYNQNIIASSPLISQCEPQEDTETSCKNRENGLRGKGSAGILGLETCSLNQPESMTKTAAQASQTVASSDDDVILNPNPDDPPVRWNSIGRSDSLRAVPKADAPSLPRTKTKREREREKLLMKVDEELDADPRTQKINDGWGGGVQEIGKGLGLERAKSSFNFVSTEEPRSNEQVSEEDVSLPHLRIDPEALDPNSTAAVIGGREKQSFNLFESTFSKQNMLGVRKAAPTLPFKTSPLNSTPIVPSDEPSTPLTRTVTPNEALSTHESSFPPLQVTSTTLDTIRDYSRSLQQPERSPKSHNSTPPISPSSGRRRDMNRVSLVAGRVVQPFTFPPSTSLPPSSSSKAADTPSLQSFSPFRSPNLPPTSRSSSTIAPHHPSIDRLDSTISIAPSTGVPSECGTPTEEKTSGIGGRGIDDYIIIKEAGKGAYGLVMRAKVKGPKGEQPVGDEVIIKYIIKARILADCWKKHKVLGPIPVEIHVMDQLRHLLYIPPKTMSPWDPARSLSGYSEVGSSTPVSQPSSTELDNSRPITPENIHNLLTTTQKYIAEEIKSSPQRGHPNICKLLDFFEDKEFYYLVMPRFGTGLDLFDRVESQPSGLESFEVRSLVGQLTDAVRFLHANGIVHRDIKDENVILDGSGHCQLIDFGSAAHWRPGKKWDTFSGTLHYASPEILRGEMYGGKEQDIWALGVVAYVLLVGETPFSDLPDEVLHGLSDGTSANAALVARCSSSQEGLEADGGGGLGDAADLVKRCMEIEANDRPSANTLLEHRYLKGRGGWVGKKGWVIPTGK